MGKVLVCLFLILPFVSCTEQQRAKEYGGESIVNLPKGEKLMIVTWKGSDLWYLHRPMKEGDTAETYYFQESSTWGILEGKITINEQK